MKLNSPLIRKIGATALGVLLLSYLIYHAFIINKDTLKTETAMFANRSDTIQADAWLVRDEKLVTKTGSGVMSYNVGNGEKVTQGNVIADIYPNEQSASARNQLANIEAEIENLKVLQSVGNIQTSSVDLVGTQINLSMGKYLENVRKGEFQGAADERNHMQYLMNQKRIITGKETAADYQVSVDELIQEKEEVSSLVSGKTGAVESPESGYFITDVDGYENSLDMKDISKVTVSEIEAIQKQYIDENAIGKIATDFKWYMVCVIDENDKVKIEDVDNVKLEVPLVTAEQIPAKVVAINKDEEQGKYALVLQCDYMNAEIASLRNETVQIVVATYEGVLVHQKAIHFNDITEEVTDESGNTTEKVHKNVKGVYVKFGRQIHFVQVFSDVTINEYAICKLSLNDEEQGLLVTDGTIQLYDEVVVEGTNLYDGKLL